MHVSKFLRLAMCVMVLPLSAHAAIELRMSESYGEGVDIVLDTPCARFGEQSGITKMADGRYRQQLNSEAGEEARYLKAARMGGGIYLHLPYFMAAGDCEVAAFDVRARHILWNGKWHAGSVSISAGDAQDKSVFLTNEAAPLIKGATYFDANMPAPTLARLEPAFAKIIGFYEDVLHADPMRDVGVVAAIVRNKGNYFGFGGDSLNIIRMSYDNPSAQHMATFDQVFPSTFAHELSHKLQSERLFAQPLARHIVEGSADFLKILVLRSAGLIDEAQARERVVKAVDDCADALRAKARQGAMKFREPYDCGMAYYFVSYYSSGMAAPEFVAALRAALSGKERYGRERALCLWFEASCRNARLKGAMGDEARFGEQAAWLRRQLATRPLPLLARGR